MNNGKICVSVAAKSAAELMEKIGRAEGSADLIEVRFDRLLPEETDRALKKLAETPELFQKLIATFRPKEQGGGREITKEERIDFWTSGVNRSFWGGDFEEDVLDLAVAANWKNRIGSVHGSPGAPLDEIASFESLSSSGASIVKIAVSAEDAVDAIGVWKLLDRKENNSRPLIPLAMGEAGKWTRILGLAHGAYMTYASLDADSATAPGQISVKDALETFRVKELTENTEVYGIIAGDTSYSASPWMHNSAFKAEEMDRVFVPLQVSDLDEFMIRMVDPETREVDLNFCGFSVTNPHKRAIIEHLHFIEPNAAKIGAVNTVKITDGKLHGYNTDAPGFIVPLKKVLGDLKKKNVAIVGAGGAARACAFALKQEGANVTIFARRQKRAAALAKDLDVREGPANHSFKPGTVDILVNATPLGTKGELQNAAIASASQMNGIKLVYDLVYNPIQTRLIGEARAAGVAALGGLDMVLAQGARQFEIWTGEKAPLDPMRKAILKRVK